MSPGKTRLRRQAVQVFKAGLKAADPRQGICRHVRIEGSTLFAGRNRYSLSKFRRIYAVGAGKASANMAVAIEKLFGSRVTSGLINTKYGHTAKLRRILLNECGHPVPDESGARGAQEIAAIAADATADDLLICLISGGASALLPLPAEGITLADKQATTGLLLACGADIHQINTVRKHISRVKGGQLTRLAYPASVLSLILSDVVGDDLDVIGSGITAPDRSTFEDAISILNHLRIMDRVPPSVRSHLQAAASETPKPGDPVFSRTQNLLIGSNRLALEAAAEHARELGFRTLILSSVIEGEARDVARVHAAVVKEIHQSGQPLKPPACVLSGGETTVTICGEGRGGRNQEFVLQAALDIAGLDETVVLSAGTDGTDGPTDAAGAVCDGGTASQGMAAGLDPVDYLARNDSYSWFDRTGGLIRTGPTGTNVMDMRVLLVGRT